ncbi:type VI secretion system tube protein TssD [Serratia fonticola]|uniref:type VI secretion system tube protein TssD n=1 Tax=Serratia fonticola TaxID=47917 RepID=UPI00351AC84A
MGNKYQIMHKDQILVLQFDHVISRSQYTNHHPIKFCKPIYKSSPLFGIVIINNEELELLFDFYRTKQTGVQEKYYSIQLTGFPIGHQYEFQGGDCLSPADQFYLLAV